MLYLSMAVASFIFVFLKAFQQRNVAFDNYLPVIPVSLGMASVEVYVIANIAQTGWSLYSVAAIGLASGSGALVAMLLHKKFLMKPKD